MFELFIWNARKAPTISHNKDTDKHIMEYLQMKKVMLNLSERAKIIIDRGVALTMLNLI